MKKKSHKAPRFTRALRLRARVFQYSCTSGYGAMFSRHQLPHNNSGYQSRGKLTPGKPHLKEEQWSSIGLVTGEMVETNHRTNRTEFKSDRLTILQASSSRNTMLLLQKLTILDMVQGHGTGTSATFVQQLPPIQLPPFAFSQEESKQIT